MITQTNLELIIEQANAKILENISKGLNHSVNDSRSLFYNFAKPYFTTNDWKSKYAYRKFTQETKPLFDNLFIQGVSSVNSNHLTFKVDIPIINKPKSISSISFDEIKNIKF